MRNGLILLLIRHGCAGAVAGWLTVALLLWTDTAGIGLLVAASDLWPIPLIMLFWSFGLTFAGLAMGAAIMSIDRRAEPRWGGRERPPVRRWLLALRCWRSLPGLGRPEPRAARCRWTGSGQRSELQRSDR